MLPHTILPLHVFEPHYRTIIKNSLDSNKLITITLFSHTLNKNEYQNKHPQLKPYICVKHIHQYEILHDDHYLLVLQKTYHTRIMNEITHTPYQKIIIEPNNLENQNTATLITYQTHIQTLTNDPIINQLNNINKIQQHLEPTRSNATLINNMIASLFSNKKSHYMILDESNPIARAT